MRISDWSSDVCSSDLKRRAVDAIAQAVGSRTVGEDMAEVAFALGAAHFGADHAVARIAMFAHRAALGGRGVTRPARPAVIFGAAVEQRRAASGATIDAVALVVGIFAGERPLGGIGRAHV